MSNLRKYTLITGATSGIGYELAAIFAQHGHHLIIVARTASDLADTAAEFSDMYEVEVVPIVKDLFSPNAAQELYDEISEKLLEVNILVNNAGQGLYGKFVDTDLCRELDIIQLNICAYVSLTKLFLRDMLRSKDGRILNVASIAGKMPGPYQAVYHGTKAFVHSFTEAVRTEIADTGITITSLLPGATDTDFFNKAEMEDSKILETELADPADVAKAGYTALMNGDDMFIYGLKNKAQVLSSNIIPDHVVAERVLKQQEPQHRSGKL
ncbi:MAG TPA: SDR family oxidoreductase [Cellvibrio sp.]|nr:SDR family oxidoreductase [Cellvibrio sp.]